MILALSLALLACTGEAPEAPKPADPAPATPAPADPPKPAPEPPDEFEGTAGATDKPSARGIGVLTAVRADRHTSYDRVVFEFSGELPGYHVEYVDKPVRGCASDEPIPVAGDAWLEVRFSPAQAHDDAGNATITEREKALSLGVLREMEITCDFEATVTWAIGSASPGKYRVVELTDPPRIAIDVRNN